jgi:hypothetical protein
VHRPVRHAATVLCLAATAAAIYNVYSDNSEVEKTAERAACESTLAGCTAQMTRLDRSPFAQTFEFATRKHTSPVTVRCARSWVLMGDYTCKLHPSDLDP